MMSSAVLNGDPELMYTCGPTSMSFTDFEATWTRSLVHHPLHFSVWFYHSMSHLLSP